MRKALILLLVFAVAAQDLPLSSDDECAAGAGGCALSALQLRGAAGAEVSCHDTQPGEGCYNEVQWARTDGIGAHPDWYPGLTPDSPVVEFQAKVHDTSPGKCPLPCSIKQKRKWCEAPPAAKLWAPAAEGGEVQVKILSYNLFWWNLFRMRGGNGNSAGKLIKAEMAIEPFDVMGFQECEDGMRVLKPVGLLEQYEVFQGEHAVCLAYRKQGWTLLDKGTENVGEDMKSHYYGRRGALWVRLKHEESGRTMLFVNHHGPLEVNSGGECGGRSIANNLAHLMHEKAHRGDLLVLVGDFNANSASLTVQELWSRLVLLHSGDSFGGVDNIFGNMAASDVISRKTLGSGGSDHDAIAAVVKVGGRARRKLLQGEGMAAEEASRALVTNPPGDDWQKFWCGLLETDLDYTVAPGGWTSSVDHHPGQGDAHDVASAQRCCRLCQRDARCKSWTWQDNGPKCLLHGDVPTGKVKTPGYVSGLPASQAAIHAAQSAKTAIKSMDEEAEQPLPEPNPGPIEKVPAGSKGASCSAYPACAAVNAQGDCCPTADGVALACCNE